MTCRICASKSDLFDTATVLGKYRAEYYRCASCGFIQVGDPHWLGEAYASPIAAGDLGYIWRNIMAAHATKACLACCFPATSRYVDYGGGYGMFVRLMRDRGYDFELYDKYCQNLFAPGLEAREENRYDLATAFEVLEHLADPVEDIGRILRFSTNLLSSTELVPSPAPKVADWWYYAPQQGQHVSFYTPRALELLAARWNLNFYTNGSGLHLFSTARISPWFFRLICGPRVALILDTLVRRPTLLGDDVARLAKAQPEK